MSDVTFTRQPNCPELYYAQCNGGKGSDAQQVAYLLPAGTQAPASFDLAASWSGNPYSIGCYFFLNTPIASGQETAFANSAWIYLGMPGRQGARFAWISNPNDQADPFDGPFIIVQAAGSGFQTGRVSQFDFRNITLIIGTQCAVSVSGLGFQITPPASAPNTIYLQAEWGQSSLNIIDPVGITIPCCPPASGCLQFSADLQKSTDLAAMDVGPRTFYLNDQGWLKDSPKADPFWLTSIRYQVFQEIAGTLPLYANLDPLDHLNVDRTYFGLFPPSGSSPAPQLTNYTTNLGQGIQLTPQAGARLVFQQNPVTSVSSNEDAYYLAPYGSFSVGLTGVSAGASLSLLCGISGVEYLSVTAGSIISFVSGQPAFADGFQPGAATPEAETSLTDLNGLVTTSWVFAPSVNYYAQPDESVLHNSGQGGLKGFLQYLPVIAGTLPQSPPATTPPAFPMLPYYNTGQSLAGLNTYNQLELQLLSPTRRQNIFEITGGVTASTGGSGQTTGWGVTPQGLAANVGAGIWSQLILAQDIQGTQLSFNQVKDLPNYPLLSALTVNQLFLVISDPASVSSFLSQASVTLKGTASGAAGENWVLNLSPEATGPESGKLLWSEYNTILVFKFFDRSLKDLAQDTGAWSQGTSFNSDPQATSNLLGKIIQDETDPSFVTAVNNKDWNGIIVLNGAIETIPKDLAGLMAGIDVSQFYCHHLGINVSPATIQGSAPSLQTTSMFGLVHYQAPHPMQNNGFDYQFQVQSLQALFQNSTITQFSSTIQLQINTLFGEACAGPDNNIINLTGVLQDQGYAYQTVGDSLFTMKSRVLDTVDLARGQFVTLDPGGAGKPTLSSFLFWGSMAFQSLQAAGANFDVFSFGTSSQSGGLSFSGLSIDMSSDKPGDADFAFDANHISFDMATTQARPDSLFNHFPLTLTGLTQSATGSAPASQGFMSVTNALGQSDLSGLWFSLNFDLNLGSLGALASEAGFVASLILAWAPNPANYSVFIGLRLPGSNGGTQRDIGLEGVLTLNFQNIQLSYQDVTGVGPSYVLTLYNIALKLLSVSFPPGGQINVYIFGNPGSSGASLGWYAGYVKSGSTSSTKKAAALGAGE